MNELFLQEILGKDGAGALNRAVERIPELKSVLLPRVIVSWLSIMGKVGYDGEIPGSNSYVSLIKSEDNEFTGALTIDNQLYSFENQDMLHVAASLGVALGLDFEPVNENIKIKELNNLGKSIDLLVKTQVVKKIKELSYDASKVGDFTIQYGGKFNPTYLVKHSTGTVIFENIENLEKAELAAKWLIKKEKLQTPIRERGLIVRDKNFKEEFENTKPTLTKLTLTKNEAERVCVECDQSNFNKDKFVGCLCLKALAKSIDTEKVANGFVLTFKRPNLDDEEISAIIDIFKGN